MRRRLSISLGVCVGAVLTLALVAPVQAQETKDKAKAPVTKSARVDGIVQMIDKATKTVTVRERAKTVQRPVVYNDTTIFTYRNMPATVDEVKDGRRVICLGRYNSKTQLIATRIEVRDEK